MLEEFEEIEVPISEIKKLLEDGIEFEIDTPDGWQQVTEYGDMGEKQTYSIFVDDIETIVAESHQIETKNGWKKAKKLVNGDLVLSRNGWLPVSIVCNDVRNVVDITIDHPNHRYYSNNISSHNCHYTAEMASQGYNVLYVSLEMAEEKLGTRIDANLMDVTMDQVLSMDEKEFMGNINRVKQKVGKIIIKEFPTASVHMGHVEAMLRELKNKKGFVPDVVCLDYLNICLSRRVGLSAGTYLFVKAITEEFRGLASKYNFVGVTATQGTRSTIEASDMTMADTGESKGINDTVDFMMAMMAPEEIAKAGLMLCKQLKSRYDDVNRKKRFVMTFDRTKMHFDEAEDPGVAASFLGGPVDNSTAPGQIEEDRPLFDSSTDNRFLGDKVKGTLEGINFK